MNDGERMGQKKSAMIMFFTGLKREKNELCICKHEFGSFEIAIY